MELEKIKQLGKYSIFRKHGLKLKLCSIFTPKCPSYSVYRNIRYMFVIPTAYCEDSFNKSGSSSEVYGNSESPSSSESLISPVTDEEVNAFIQNETGRDRLHRMFSRNPVTKTFSEDMGSVTRKAGVAAVSAAVLSFFFEKDLSPSEMAPGIKQIELYSKKARYAEQRKIYDRILLNRMNMMFKWGFVAGLFIGSFFLTAQTIATYRNKSSPFEYAAGGVLTGSLFRIHIGPKAVLTGGAILGFGGFAFGLLMYGMRYVTETTQDVVHFNYIKQLMETKSLTRPELSGNEEFH